MNSLNNKQDLLNVGNGIIIVNNQISDTTWTKGNGTIYSFSNIGIGTSEPSSKLHVIGDIKYTGTLFQNDTDILSTKANIGHTHLLADIVDLNNTDDLPVGSTNIFFDYVKTGNIIQSSNIGISNYILNTSNKIVQDLLLGSIANNNDNDSIWGKDISYISYCNIRVFPDNIKIFKNDNYIDILDTGLVSKYSSNYINNTSNELLKMYYNKNRFDSELNNTSNFFTDVYNYLYQNNINTNLIERFNYTSNYIDNTFNLYEDIFSNRYFKNDIDNELVNTSNFVKITSNYIIDRITNISTDDITEGDKKFIDESITSNFFNTNIHLDGTFRANNLIVNDITTNINTSFQTERLNIISNSNGNEPAIKITQDISGENILDLNSGKFTILDNGYVGINKSLPTKTLDIVGNCVFANSVKANSFTGNGSQLTNVNINIDNFSGVLPANKGGTGNTYFIPNRIVLYDGTKYVSASNVYIFDGNFGGNITSINNITISELQVNNNLYIQPITDLNIEYRILFNTNKSGSLIKNKYDSYQTGFNTTYKKYTPKLLTNLEKLIDTTDYTYRMFKLILSNDKIDVVVKYTGVNKDVVSKVYTTHESGGDTKKTIYMGNISIGSIFGEVYSCRNSNDDEIYSLGFGTDNYLYLKSNGDNFSVSLIPI